MYGYLLLLHLLGATVWTGGHIILTTLILPEAIRTRSVGRLLRFESRYEKVGIPALLIQIVTGLWLASLRVPDLSAWLDWSDPSARLIMVKLSLLALTAAFAADARLRLIPTLTANKLRSLALHIVPVTLLSILFVVAGVSFRGVDWF